MLANIFPSRKGNQFGHPHIANGGTWTSDNLPRKDSHLYNPTEKRFPKMVSTAIATNPAVCSGPSKKCKAEPMDHAWAEQTERKYVKPPDLDVLFGQGVRNNHHSRNQKFLGGAEHFYELYETAGDQKGAKMAISQELVDAVHEWHVCFLKLEDGAKDKWYKAANANALKKAVKLFAK